MVSTAPINLNGAKSPGVQNWRLTRMVLHRFGRPSNQCEANNCFTTLLMFWWSFKSSYFWCLSYTFLSYLSLYTSERLYTSVAFVRPWHCSEDSAVAKISATWTVANSLDHLRSPQKIFNHSPCMCIYIYIPLYTCIRVCSGVVYVRIIYIYIYIHP